MCIWADLALRSSGTMSSVTIFIDSTISSSCGLIGGCVNLRLFIGERVYEKVEKPFMCDCVLRISLRPEYCVPKKPLQFWLLSLVRVFRRIEFSDWMNWSRPGMSSDSLGSQLMI